MELVYKVYTLENNSFYLQYIRGKSNRFILMRDNNYSAVGTHNLAKMLVENQLRNNLLGYCDSECLMEIVFVIWSLLD